ncbi:hypothetical protein ICV01_06300 [Polynucleobacter sp. MWH-Spelu-300-X4]|uniref:hypothetical protein n=1 Tax=Polynucleobacter sp. MWH-Spelu-300-X4 TaxID=2689109 RepID=UPI001BFEDA0C|nr:hypothetical protein [Polynucleobacter sp. MWH-Spelu-300-X4]QWD79259.1 hypothetical protein ICV01_06300 [Polynucleobacter sp. MWH-Spelu-300-X4]
MAKKPGQNTGTQGGVFQQVTSTGKPVSNYVTVSDHKPLPPTSKPGHLWNQIVITPNSKR